MWLYRSLAKYTEINDFLGIVEVHNHLGLLHPESENPSGARTEFDKAIKLMEEYDIGSLREKALTCDGMGDCYQVEGEFAAVMTSYEEALDIYSRIGADQARDRVAKKLDELRGHADA